MSYHMINQLHKYFGGITCFTLYKITTLKYEIPTTAGYHRKAGEYKAWGRAPNASKATDHGAVYVMAVVEVVRRRRRRSPAPSDRTRARADSREDVEDSRYRWHHQTRPVNDLLLLVVVVDSAYINQVSYDSILISGHLSPNLMNLGLTFLVS